MKPFSRINKIKVQTEGVNVFALETGDLQFLLETVDVLKKENEQLRAENDLIVTMSLKDCDKLQDAYGI